MPFSKSMHPEISSKEKRRLLAKENKSSCPHFVNELDPQQYINTDIFTFLSFYLIYLRMAYNELTIFRLANKEKQIFLKINQSKLVQNNIT